MKDLLNKTFIWCEEEMIVDEVLLGGDRCVARSLDTDMIKHFNCSYVKRLIEKQTKQELDKNTKCYLCSEKLEEEYQVMIYLTKCHSYDPISMEFVKCCSMECANALKEKNYKVYKSMADDIKNQCIQRLK